MAKSSLNLHCKDTPLYQQARNSSHYVIMDHETNEIKTIPIDPNLQTFGKNSVRKKFLDILFKDQVGGRISKEFSYNLIMFYCYFCISSAIILFTVGFLYAQDSMKYSVFVFHLVFIICVWGLAGGMLSLITKVDYWLINSQFLMCIFSSIWMGYLILCNQGVISAIFSDEGDQKIHFSIALAGFVYFYRLIVYDSFVHVIIPFFGAILIGIILSMVVSKTGKVETINDYLQYTLILLMHTIECQKVSYRVSQLFFRWYNEELKNKDADYENLGNNFDLVSNTELVVEKCEKVIKEIELTRKTIIYKDIRERLKSCCIILRELKRYLGRYARSETINFAENSNIGVEDKEFISQNFLNVKKSNFARSKERHGTLRDFIERKMHFSFSQSMLSENMNTLDTIGENWNLDMLEFHERAGHSISAIGKHLYHHWRFSELLFIDEEIAYRFFEHLEIVSYIQNYQNNPYHTAVHAADVFNSMYYFMSQSDIEKVISPQESLACLIAALGHDVGHPGVTNRYLMASRSSLAIRYNDSSILENMHCAMIYTILGEPQCDIFMNINKDLWMSIRKLIIEMVLHTDMSRHFELLGRFRARAVTTNDLNLENADDRAFVLAIGLKCADLGHSAKEFTLHEKWTLLVCQEFFNQGDLEKKNSLPVSMYCDRDNTDIPKSQNGFLKSVCLPLYEVFAGFLRSEAISRNCVDQIRENLIRWDDCARTKGDDKTLQKNKEEFMVRVISLKS